MPRRGFAVLCLIPQTILAGCLSFLDPPADSGCTRPSDALRWSGAGRLLERVKLPGLFYDRELYDSALIQGLAVRGDVRFELRVPGPHLVEVFLAAPPDDGSSFILEAGDQTVDRRYQAFPRAAPLGPRTGMRSICLLGVISGAFAVRSDSPRYFISAVRWTPQIQFEEKLAPGWLDRARQLAADPFFEDLRAARRVNLEQLYDRLALSTRPEIHREAVIGQARAAYWLAAENHDAGDIARLDTLLREAFKLAPTDTILRQMISSSCTERNVQSARMPYSSYCAEAAPVPWTVTVSPDPAGAPEWAVTQRRLAARLEAITRWWVERRQRANGELGGGWDGDAEMLRQWGPVALGLGSPVAADGLRRLAEGLKEADPGRTQEAEAWLTALAPAEARDVPRTRDTPDVAASREPGEPMPLVILWSMASAARESEAVLNRDFDMYTSEVIYTDRVYYPLTPEYLRHLLGGEAPGGDRDPTYAVTWPPAQTEFARAVIDAGPTSVRLRLYSFEARPAAADVRLWRLEPGRYRWTAAASSGAQVAAGDLVVARRAQDLRIPLPPTREIDVTIRKVGP